ncbi:Tim44 domain-containing protein [Falsochrobactrum sp. TDYN1]|uniref:Tim44 domain-containing protein n=1 Tax=Falsochrobactrum tianjinense TaxID=2706015 RepID=A0A949UTH3_9HYPH|nr:Tim44 domain-containing protein [Falsochrobactrum sp. TDYN1]MBV2143820.1 Tim44 domain-containing protein [Falsochrobactrum sp. TDYN1]
MPGSAKRLTKLTAALILGLAASFAAVDFAEARRGGGGFGSRGARTYQAPAPTRTAPNNAAPIQRSMTPNTGTNTQTNRPAAGAQNAAAQRSGGMFGNFGRSMLGGLLVGGLIGMLLGNGLGGLAGMFGLLLQVAVIALIAMFVMRMFANRRQTAAAGAGNAGAQGFGVAKTAAPQPGFGARAPSVNPFEQKQPEAPEVAAAGAAEDEPIEIGQSDLDRFEEMLTEIQGAYSREDYAALRALTTPEAMSYLAEELGEIASGGMRNEVKDVKLLQGDISEAWREGDTDYATVAIRYSAIDIMRDRNTGAVVQGDLENPEESVEVWTYTRKDGGEWKLAAIQGTE